MEQEKAAGPLLHGAVPSGALVSIRQIFKFIGRNRVSTIGVRRRQESQFHGGFGRMEFKKEDKGVLVLYQFAPWCQGLRTSRDFVRIQQVGDLILACRDRAKIMKQVCLV